MVDFPMKFKLTESNMKKKVSGNTYDLVFKYESPSVAYSYTGDALKGTLRFSSSEKNKIDDIKEKMNVLNIGELFFLGVSKDPQKRLDEYLFPDKAEKEPEIDMFEQFKQLVKGMSGHQLSPKFYEISEEIKTIEQKSRTSKADKERLAFFKQCHEHLEQEYYIPPQTSYYEPNEDISSLEEE